MASRVLIVEDERDIRDLVLFHLEREGVEVSSARRGEEARRQARPASPDLVLLDLMLPAMGGLEVCRELRQDPATVALPIVMLTAKGDEVDRVLGLELGADDYIVKPFSPKELLARVRAVLPRAKPAPGAAAIAIGPLAIDPGTRTLTLQGAPLTLTHKEFELLGALADAQGRALSREFLLDGVWGYSRAGGIESGAGDGHVRRLRGKLGAEGDRLLTRKSDGYRAGPGSAE